MMKPGLKSAPVTAIACGTGATARDTETNPETTRTRPIVIAVIRRIVLRMMSNCPQSPVHT